ncbi:AAA family ATPase [Limnothrix sp. FACHB-1083]|uniref:AAA family ATPase n=1 Tax=unclassified Limnothrix TaxID=2632864 RepID=UPI00167FEC08|nr:MULTISPECIES: AAA family ATPase [unclassified Limnothrix]MBD2160341.1 AAA family ATPase [Limnothrix sp. FACHB-1083]MBD2191042.1 AAA family ATPase [Limnothrix sp. FACHB-1088]
MKIQKISVDGLFDVFNHEISLNLSEKITIIHGPNGFGKTAILRMLNGFFNAQYSIFKKIPFRNFQIEFVNGDSVAIKGNTKDKMQSHLQDIEFVYREPGQEDKVFCLKSNQRMTKRKMSNFRFDPDVWEEVIPEIRQIGSKLWRDLRTGEPLTAQEVLEKYGHLLTDEGNPYTEDDWLIKLKSDVHIRLIESQRLLNFLPSRSSRSYSGSPSMSPTVLAYSEEIAQLIKSKLAEYGATSQSLDRTFPARVVKQPLSPEVTDEQLRQQLDELEETRSGLIEIGLLDQDGDTELLTQLQSIDESTRNVLSVYIEDVEKKLDVFREIANKIDLLKRIINKKFSYSYKEISFSKDKGFVFNTLYHPNSPDHGTVSPTDLSSGEQHELVLLYELLFKVQPNSLVLIDEPELSLHVGWQSQFLKDLQEITELADLDILIATHSPDIIQDRWDLTVELKRPQQ